MLVFPGTVVNTQQETVIDDAVHAQEPGINGELIGNFDTK